MIGCLSRLQHYIFHFVFLLSRLLVFAYLEDSLGLELGTEGPRLLLPTDSVESEERDRMRPPS